VTVKILVVEDEPVIALDIKQRLTHLGYQVVAIADCAEAALAAVAQHQPDLALMDIRIRGEINGIATAAKVREEHNLPVVFLTAHADAATLAQVKATQPFGYITKPFETQDLSTAIEIALSRQQAEIAIQNALIQEKELHEMKSQFIAVVSHEFRNPLSSILFCIDLLERHDQLSAEKKQLYLQRARSSVERMKELLEEVLIIGEADAGKLQCQPTPLDLLSFCQELIEELQNRAGHQCTLAFTLYKAENIELTSGYFDEKLLRHILSNLLSNAVKYSPEGGDVRLDVLYQPDQVTFRVQDQGIGIPASDLNQIFHSFHRAKNAKIIPGTGLGLSIVKQCVEAHGGDITVESQEGIGTTFTVTLQQSSDNRMLSPFVQKN
jgi:signal transduction histidine kinase